MNDSLNHLLKCWKTLIHSGTVTVDCPEMHYRPVVTKVILYMNVSHSAITSCGVYGSICSVSLMLSWNKYIYLRNPKTVLCSPQKWLNCMFSSRAWMLCPINGLFLPFEIKSLNIIILNIIIFRCIRALEVSTLTTNKWHPFSFYALVV